MKRALLLLAVLISTTVHGVLWHSNGPAGGSVRMIAAAPSNRRILYVTSISGAFRSSDAGATWSNIGGPFINANLVTVDPTDENVAYVTGIGGLYKTSDGGASWSHLANGIPAASTGLTAVLIDPRDPNVVYVGSKCAPFFKGPSVSSSFSDAAGVYKSTDGGATFRFSMFGVGGFPLCVTEMALDPLHPDTLYARPVFSDGGYVRSDDGARTWTRAASALPGRNVIADPRNDRIRYGTGGGALMTSVDGGVTWSQITPTLLTPGDPALTGGLAPGFALLAFDPAVPRLFFGGLLGLFRSGNGGVTVLPITGHALRTINGGVFDPVDGSLIIGTDETVEKSSGYPWSDWTILQTGDKSVGMTAVVASRHDPATAYAKSTRLFVTHDYGQSWSLLRADPLPTSNDQPLSIEEFDVDAGETLYVTAVDRNFHQSVFKLPAGSAHWIELHPGSFLKNIIADPRKAGTLYGIEFNNKFFRTRDGGSTWEALFASPAADLWQLAIDPSDSNTIHATTSVGMIRSSDGGLSWFSRLPQPTFLSHLTISPADPKTVYVDANTETGVAIYRSRDRGETWFLRSVPRRARSTAWSPTRSIPPLSICRHPASVSSEAATAARRGRR